jgi:hypothetical protein
MPPPLWLAAVAMGWLNAKSGSHAGKRVVTDGGNANKRPAYLFV